MAGCCWALAGACTHVAAGQMEGRVAILVRQTEAGAGAAQQQLWSTGERVRHICLTYTHTVTVGCCMDTVTLTNVRAIHTQARIQNILEP